MTFGPWEIPDSELLEASLRFERGQKIAPSAILAVDQQGGVSSILGSGGFPYTVTLAGCECSDFQRRGLPCKHMIRLAVELGTVFDVPQFDPCAAADYDVEADIAHLTERWRAGQLTLDALAKCAGALRASAEKARRPRGRPRKVG